MKSINLAFKLTLSLFLSAQVLFCLNVYGEETSLIQKTVIDKTKQEKQINSDKLNQQTSLNLPDYPHKKSVLTHNNHEKEYKGPGILSLIGSLSFVLLLIFILSKLYAKLFGINTFNKNLTKINFKKDDKFNILTTCSLGQGRNLHLIEIKQKQFIIGSTANNISLLSEVKDNEIYTDNQEEYNDEASLNNFEVYKDYIKQKNTENT